MTPSRTFQKDVHEKERPFTVWLYLDEEAGKGAFIIV